MHGALRTSMEHARKRWRGRARGARCSVMGLVVICAAAGCASPEPRQELPLQSAPAFSVSGEVAAPDRWWTAFADEGLNTRVERALSGNFSLASAWERLREAEAVTRRARSARRPRMDGVAGGALRDGSDIDGQSEVSLGLEASYEVDLWGRIGSLVEAERLRASATAADYYAAAISLSAEVALTWYELAEARQQLELIGSQLETNLAVLQVLENRFAVGQSGSADVLRQRQLVEATREQAVVAEVRVEVLEHRLAVLEGRPPQGEVEVAPGALPAAPPLPRAGLPADLLQRRPDVLAALLRLEAADADVAAAVRDQYPRLDLLAAVSTAAENPAGLFESWLASIAAQVVAPLYDGGQRRAEVERAAAVRRQFLAEYGQTVLEAFAQVEDALTQEAHEARRIESLQQQLDLAQSTYRQLRSQYLNGAADYLEVLTALREQQDLERSLLAAELERLVFRIALHRALAGGFQTPREQGTPESTPQSEPESAVMKSPSGDGERAGD